MCANELIELYLDFHIIIDDHYAKKAHKVMENVISRVCAVLPHTVCWFVTYFPLCVLVCASAKLCTICCPHHIH